MSAFSRTIGFIVSLPMALAAWSEARAQEAWYAPGQVWQGTGSQPGMRWSIRIVFDAAGRGRIEYPSLGCGGTLQPIRMTTRGGEFQERITFGHGRCVDGGRVGLMTQGEGSLSYSWNGFHGGRPIAAGGSLSLPRQASAPAAQPAPQQQAAPSHGLSRAEVAELQAALAALGHDPGPADGSLGPRTRGAAEAFARELGQPIPFGPQLLGAARAAVAMRARQQESRPQALTFGPFPPGTYQTLSISDLAGPSASSELRLASVSPPGRGEVRIAPGRQRLDIVLPDDGSPDPMTFRVSIDRSGSNALTAEVRVTTAPGPAPDPDTAAWIGRTVDRLLTEIVNDVESGDLDRESLFMIPTITSTALISDPEGSSALARAYRGSHHEALMQRLIAAVAMERRVSSLGSPMDLRPFAAGTPITLLCHMAIAGLPRRYQSVVLIFRSSPVGWLAEHAMIVGADRDARIERAMIASFVGEFRRLPPEFGDAVCRFDQGMSLDSYLTGETRRILLTSFPGYQVATWCGQRTPEPARVVP